MDNYFIYAFTLIQVNTLLKNNIEGIILKWSYQVYIERVVGSNVMQITTSSTRKKKKLLNFPFQTEEVLSKDSAEDLNKGLNPGPMTEIKFWEAKVGGFGSTLALLPSSVHQPGVTLRADEGRHHQEDGLNTQCHRQCLLPHLQV